MSDEDAQPRSPSQQGDDAVSLDVSEWLRVEDDDLDDYKEVFKSLSTRQQDLLLVMQRRILIENGEVERASLATRPRNRIHKTYCGEDLAQLRINCPCGEVLGLSVFVNRVAAEDHGVATKKVDAPFAKQAGTGSTEGDEPKSPDEAGEANASGSVRLPIKHQDTQCDCWWECDWWEDSMGLRSDYLEPKEGVQKPPTGTVNYVKVEEVKRRNGGAWCQVESPARKGDGKADSKPAAAEALKSDHATVENRIGMHAAVGDATVERVERRERDAIDFPETDERAAKFQKGEEVVPSNKCS